MITSLQVKNLYSACRMAIKLFGHSVASNEDFP